MVVVDMVVVDMVAVDMVAVDMVVVDTVDRIPATAVDAWGTAKPSAKMLARIAASAEKLVISRPPVTRVTIASPRSMTIMVVVVVVVTTKPVTTVERVVTSPCSVPRPPNAVPVALNRISRSTVPISTRPVIIVVAWVISARNVSVWTPLPLVAVDSRAHATPAASMAI